MTIDSIRAAMHAIPFRPFTLYTTDGRTFTVQHPDFIATSPGGRTIVVYDSEEGSHILELALVTELYAPPAPSPPESKT